MKRILVAISAVLFCFASCQSVDFEKSTIKEAEKPENATNYEEELKETEKQDEKYFIDEELKTVDIEKSVVYVEKPVYYPLEPAEKKATGKDAAKKSFSSALQEPWKYSGGKMFYDYDENFVYEIYCQPYRITDLALEPGEMVLENPFLSESQVWEIGAGVSRKNGEDVQHFYFKPDMSGLTTSLIIITDRRVYNFLLKSFRDCYMPMVEFEYPNTMPYKIKTDAMDKLNELRNEKNSIDPKYLSFDYKMKYSIFHKPLWLPKRVYDDGRKTYIQLDERVLHSESPVLFNKSNRRINYRVDKNLIIIDELIEKVTLRLGKEKVVIVKKTYKEPKEAVIEEAASAEKPSEEIAKTERKGRQIHAQFPVPEPEKDEAKNEEK